jgi:hypothetical protein
MLKTEVLFSNTLFRQIDQLADILYGDSEQVIKLESEHEWVTQSWIASSLVNSKLAQHAPLNQTWCYAEGGLLARKQDLLVGSSACQILRFPALTHDQQADFIDQKIRELYHQTPELVSRELIEQTLQWQSRFSPREQVLTEAFRVIQRAINRLVLMKKSLVLDVHHIADVIGDWQSVALPLIGLQDHLESHVLGQAEAINSLVRHQQSQRFVLAGPENTGRHSFAKAYAIWLHGDARFCVSIDLEKTDNPDTALLESPHPEGIPMTIIQIVRHYPDTVFLVEKADIFPQRLKTLLDIKARFMILVDCIHEKSVPVQAPNSLECILYRDDAEVMVARPESVERLEALQARLPAEVIESSVMLFFKPLDMNAKRGIIRKNLIAQLAAWQAEWRVVLYFQEEVISYLLKRIDEQGFSMKAIAHLLQEKVLSVFQRTLNNKVINDGQALTLQLNDAGNLLMITLVPEKNTLIALSLDGKS